MTQKSIKALLCLFGHLDFYSTTATLAPSVVWVGTVCLADQRQAKWEVNSNPAFHWVMAAGTGSSPL